MTTLTDLLAGTARFAAKVPPGDAAREIAAAAMDGAWAARHGCRLPLFPLLDARGILQRFERRFRSPLPDPGRADTPDTRRYDHWVWSFCSEAARRNHLGLVAEPRAGETAAPAPSGYLPLLMAQWPGRTVTNPDADTGADWVGAFAALSRNPALAASAAAQWAAKRETAASAWAKWWPAKGGPESPEPIASATWARFAADRPDLSLHEHCDHAAAALYFETSDPKPTDEQAARLRQLRLVLAELQRPTVESWEEQDPYVGATTLFTHTLGEYGKFKMINGSDPKIATPPRARLPNRFDVHLCWLVGYQSLRATVPEPREPARTTTASSVFQGLLGLLLDDWRAALNGIYARVHLHRGTPGPEDGASFVRDELTNIRPGVRWKTDVGRDNGSMPPPRVIGYLFRRHSLAELAAWRPRWSVPGSGRSTNQWWCGAVTTNDLPTVGFEKLPTRDEGETPAWIGHPGLAPEPLRDVLVIDPGAADGRVYRVLREAHQTRLQPVARGLRSTDPTDGSFPAFRRAALDALLDAVLSARV